MQQFRMVPKTTMVRTWRTCAPELVVTMLDCSEAGKPKRFRCIGMLVPGSPNFAAMAFDARSTLQTGACSRKHKKHNDESCCMAAKYYGSHSSVVLDT